MNTADRNESKKVFAVPYNGKSDLIERAVDSDLCDHIHEFFGTDNAFVHGRSKVQITTPHQFESDVKLMINNNIHFNYLLNAICIDTYMSALTLLEDKLKQLRELGVTVLTVTHPVVAEFIQSKGFDFDINCSVNNFVNSVDRALMLVKTGYTRITVDEDQLRNIPLIQNIVKRCGVPVEIMINNACVRGCINRLSHQSILGQPVPGREEQVKIKRLDNLMISKCTKMCRSDLGLFLKGTWIRPEDLERYLDIGVRIFKIPGREFPTDVILQHLRIYASRAAYSGKISDYLLTKDYASRYGVDKIESKDVEVYFEHVWSGCEGDDCRQCQLIAEQVARRMERKSGKSQQQGLGV